MILPVAQSERLASYMNSDTHSMADYETPGGETASGSNQEVRWVTVKRTPGITVAEIYVGRLQSEGIPARAWQEGAGEALGLTVGLLGTGHVVVPEEYAAQAEAILDEAEAEFGVDEEE
jgi:hypothetical protein